MRLSLRMSLRIGASVFVLSLGAVCLAVAASADSDWSDEERSDVAQVAKLFTPPEGVDPASRFRDDAVWWNALSYLVGNEGNTEHEGTEAIPSSLYGAGSD